MTPERQRIQIAGLLGWKHLPKDPEMIQYTAENPDGKWVVIPDYPNDLNAMHEAEKMLSMHPDFEYKYGEALARVTIGPERDEEDFVPNGWGYFSVLRSTAAQRAEAFLKTLELWEEDSLSNTQLSNSHEN